MKISKKLSKKKIINLTIFFVAFFLIILGYKGLLKNEPVSEIKISDNNPSWNTYINYDYNFSIDFPPDWKIYEDFENVSPTINIYIPNKNIKPPFDQFAEVNNVSIFPKGLPMGAVIGQSTKTEIEFDFDSNEAVDYVIDNGDAWASYINVGGLRDPWKPWGFIWAKVIINNVEYRCLDGQTEIHLDECNPFEGDEFVRVGEVDYGVREIQKKIIESFKIIGF